MYANPDLADDAPAGDGFDAHGAYTRVDGTPMLPLLGGFCIDQSLDLIDLGEATEP